MKRNKIAAGALALALGFGAVAPVHADEGNPSAQEMRDLANELKNLRKDIDEKNEEIPRLLGIAEEKERERQGAAQEGEADVEDNNNTGDKTEPSTGGKTTPSDDETTKPSTGGKATPSDDETTKPSTGGKTTPSDDETTKPSTGGKTTPSNDDKDKDKDKDKKVYDLADNEEKGYDTKADAIAAAKQALADKAYNAAGNNSYEVAKNENNGKWFFKLVIDTDKAIAEENKEDKKEDKEDNKSQAPARKADSNAQTGVAGLVSVASILGAASVAYVASKKRD